MKGNHVAEEHREEDNLLEELLDEREETMVTEHRQELQANCPATPRGRIAPRRTTSVGVETKNVFGLEVQK